MTTKTILAILALAALATAAAPAAASHWCGENGLIRFSFAEGDTLVPVAHVEPDQDGVTRVTLQVWLTDVEPMAHDGEALLGVGGFELALEVEGGEVFIADRIFPSMAMNVAKDEWGIVTGLNPNPRLEDGRALLVTYKLMFMGRPENVRFGIRPEGLYSCPTVDGCAGSGTRALWIGPTDADMLSEIFGAGCVPGWLNPTGEPDLTPQRGTSGWRDVGRFQPR